jgi:hypothetical protein
MRQALTAVTGAHTVKVGLNETWAGGHDGPYAERGAGGLRVNGAVPYCQITERAFPLSTKTDETSTSEPVQTGGL